MEPTLFHSRLPNLIFIGTVLHIGWFVRCVQAVRLCLTISRQDGLTRAVFVKRASLDETHCARAGSAFIPIEMQYLKREECNKLYRGRKLAADILGATIPVHR
jgi:hypothetical protein